MEPKKSTRNQGTENAAVQNNNDGTPQTDPVEMLRADQQALCSALIELDAAPAGGAQVYDLCWHHITTIGEIVLPAMKRAGVAEDRLQEVMVWHDILTLLLADLKTGWSAVQEYRAKQAVFTHLMAKLLKQEEEAGTGVFALLAASKPDLTAIGPIIQNRKTVIKEQAESVATNRPTLNILRLDMFIRPQNTPLEDDPMERNQYERRRDDDGRYTSSRSDRYGRDGDDRSDGRGWHGDSRGHAEAARLGWERRDDHYRSARDDDDDRHYGRGRSGGGSNSGNDRSRDSQGRFMSDDDHDNRRYGNRGNGDQSRDEYGRFTSDDDDRRGGSRGSRYSSRERDDDDRRYGNRGNGDQARDGYGRFTSDDDDQRGSSHGGRYSSRDRDDDDDRRYSSRDRSGRDDRSDDHGRGGWFGDPRGHSEASRRGWEDRRR